MRILIVNWYRAIRLRYALWRSNGQSWWWLNVKWAPIGSSGWEESYYYDDADDKYHCLDPRCADEAPDIRHTL